MRANNCSPACTGETLAHFEAVATLLALFSHFDVSFAPGYLESTPMIKTEWCEHRSPKYRPALTLPMVRSAPCLIRRLQALVQGSTANSQGVIGLCTPTGLPPARRCEEEGGRKVRTQPGGASNAFRRDGWSAARTLAPSRAQDQSTSASMLSQRRKRTSSVRETSGRGDISKPGATTDSSRAAQNAVARCSAARLDLPDETPVVVEGQLPDRELSHPPHTRLRCGRC